MESVASFASDEVRQDKHESAKRAKRSWFTITLGPTDELEETSDNEDGTVGNDGQTSVGGGLSDVRWESALLDAGLTDTDIAAIRDAFAPVERLADLTFISDEDFRSKGGLDEKGLAALHSAVAIALKAEADANPTMDWRVFLAAADLNQYVPVLEKRGVRSHYELGLITDEEYSKLTSSGMAVHEISALRKVLLNSDHAALRQVPQLASKKAVDRAGGIDGIDGQGGERRMQTVDLGAAIMRDSMTFFEALFDNTQEALGSGNNTDDSEKTNLAATMSAAEGDSASTNDVIAKLLTLSSEKGAALLDDVSFDTQVRLLSSLPSSKAAAVITEMQSLDSAARGAILLALPMQTRGSIIVELRPSTLAGVMASVSPREVLSLLLSLDAKKGDRSKALQLLHEDFARVIIAALTAKECGALMEGMGLPDQAKVISLLNDTEKTAALKTLMLETQVALLSGMSENDRATVLESVDPAVKALLLVELPDAEAASAMAELSPDDAAKLLKAGMAALSRIEITQVDALNGEELFIRLHRLEDLAAETSSKLRDAGLMDFGVGASGDKEDDNLAEITDDDATVYRRANKKKRLMNIWQDLRGKSRAAAAAARDLCLALQTKRLNDKSIDDKKCAPPRDIVEQLALAQRRSKALRLLLGELSFLGTEDEEDLIFLGHTDGKENASHSLSGASQEDLLRELARRVGAGNDDPHMVIERLALATGFVKKTNTAILRSQKNNAEENAGRDVRFSIRISGILLSEFNDAKQSTLETELARGYGIADGASMRIVGISSGGSVAGLAQNGKDSAGELVVDIFITGYKAPAAAKRFVKKANDMGVPLSRATYGYCTFENPPIQVLARDQGGDLSNELSMSTNLPLPPMIVAATPGDGEAKILLLSPNSLGSPEVLDTSVIEMEVISSPGRLRAIGKPGEPVIVKGLTNGTTYRFTAHARNITGWGGFSSPSSPVSPGDLTASPLPPEISAVSTAETDVEVNVLVAAPGKYFLRPITLVEVKSEPDNVVAFAPPGVPVLLQNLRPNVNYRFRARAKNMNGWSRSSKPTAPIALLCSKSRPSVSGNHDNEKEDATTQQSLDVQGHAQTFADHVPPDYFYNDEVHLDGAAKRALQEHMLERDLIRKGKSPLEVLLHKQRHKKDMLKMKNSSELHEKETDDARDVGELNLEDAVKLNDQRQQLKPLCFTVKQEMNISNDVFSKQMKDIDGLSSFDNKFLRRFVGLMALHGMHVYKHGRTGRRKVLIKVDPKGMRLYWNSKSKRKSEAEKSIDFAHDVSTLSSLRSKFSV